MIIHKMKNLSQRGYQQYQKLHQKNIYKFKNKNKQKNTDICAWTLVAAMVVTEKI